ncbi:DUF2793 domain-containing protein [Faunimonas sp. B44]|uniref:DUF2793 domain-containing protein n=1 Tax=Faunimonas sp. B44 TaxID=3461493 RepID=UPI004043CD6B
MSETMRLKLPLILAEQAQKHVTHNEALGALDAIVQLAVVTRALDVPPGAPADGARYIVASGASDAWAGKDLQVAAWQDGAWAFHPPGPGWLAWAIDEAALLFWDGAAWQSVTGAIAALQNLALLGIGTAADATNPFSAKLNKALWTAKTAAEGGNGDLRYTMNKEGAADVLSLLLQSNWSGRAELGLIGDDDFSLKVSADGTSWTEALRIDRSTGAADFPLGAAQVQVDKFTASGTWTRPAWAKLVRVICIAGGDGGASGATRGAGVAVSGGGGGGCGAMTEANFAASDLAATVAVTIGAGGAGGAAVSASSTNGNAGSTGGSTSFGSHLQATGNNNTAATGGSTAASPAGGVLPWYRFTPTTGANQVGGAGSAGAGSNTSPTFASNLLPGCGGGGGGVSAAEAFGAGGSGARTGLAVLNSGTGLAASGGSSEGQAGSTGVSPAGAVLIGGGGGGGGAGGVAASGGAGGNGGAPGGGGGGGGAARNGFTSGKGGDGARGECWVVSTG